MGNELWIVKSDDDNVHHYEIGSEPPNYKGEGVPNPLNAGKSASHVGQISSNLNVQDYFQFISITPF